MCDQTLIGNLFFGNVCIPVWNSMANIFVMKTILSYFSF